MTILNAGGVQQLGGAVMIVLSVVPAIGGALVWVPAAIWLALTGCTLSTDHHYVFPAGAGDLLLHAEEDAFFVVAPTPSTCAKTSTVGRSRDGRMKLYL